MCTGVERNQEKRNKRIEDNIIKNVINLFKLQKENEAIKYRIIRIIGDF